MKVLINNHHGSTCELFLKEKVVNKTYEWINKRILGHEIVNKYSELAQRMNHSKWTFVHKFRNNSIHYIINLSMWKQVKDLLNENKSNKVKDNPKVNRIILRYSLVSTLYTYFLIWPNQKMSRVYWIRANADWYCLSLLLKISLGFLKSFGLYYTYLGFGT